MTQGKLTKKPGEITPDLKAENDALKRQLEIEAALERVRSRMLAMKKSKELEETTLVMYKQLDFLGVVPKGSGVYIAILEQDTDTALQWIVTDKSLIIAPGERRTPMTEHPLLIKTYEGWKRKEPLLIRDLSGKELQEFVGYFQSLPSWKEGELKAANLPDRLIWSEASFSQGTLGLIHQTPLTEETLSILVRFSKVFDLTYTRFLDLKKAEEQAREAQIEVALERVRSRSMAMQNSNELSEILGLIFKELTTLDIDLARCIIWIIDRDTETATFWLASPYDEIGTRSYFIPKFNHPYYKQYIKAWKSREALWKLEVHGKLKERWHDYLFKETELRLLPKDVIRSMRAPDKFYTINTFNKHGLICAAGTEPFSDESNDIFKRFGRVFEQCYTRFEDIKKAEEQAREAEIELALERVRARTMAMQHSEELAEVALVLWEQLHQLKLKGLPGCAIHVNDDEKGTFNVWGAFPDPVNGDQQMKLTSATHDQNCNWVFRQWYKYYRAGETAFTAVCNAKQVEEFIDYFEPNLPFLAKEMRSLKLDKLYVNGVAFSNGILGAHSMEPLSEETWSVFKRLNGVFDMAYRRFEDLKKAEEQAREAQIEVALERVRARAMAMHKSEELYEIAKLLYRELHKLGIVTFSCGYVLIDEKEDQANVWMTNPEGGLWTVPLSEERVLKDRHQSWKRKDQIHRTDLTGRDLNIHLNYIAKHSPLTPAETEVFLSTHPTDLVLTSAHFSHGYLLVVSEPPVTEEDESMFIRFAQVFEMTYRRYLDLKKAEAQAREAQIESALERVRARALAMHTSDEILEVADVMREEMGLLGQPELAVSAVHIYTKNAPTFDTWWAFIPSGKRKRKILTGRSKIRINTSALAQEFIEKHQSNQNEYTIYASGKKLRDWQKEVAFVAPKQIKSYRQQLPKEQYFHFSDFTGGALAMVSYQEPSQESKDLQKRAASVFNLAYQRFLDLKKAEAQTREAQIEAALERVRARTMGMRSSNEMLEVGASLYQELTDLGIASISSGITLMGKDGKIDWYYMVETDSKSIMRSPMGIPRDETKVMRSLTSGWENQEPYQIVVLNKKQTIAHQTYIAENSINFHLSAQELIALSPVRLTLQTFNFKHGYLLLVGEDKLSKDTIDIGIRFAKVFEQTYTRFLDLKKSEEQARESQIEAALERVRAAAMAMHSSDDLFSVAEVLHDQLAQLGQEELESSIIQIYPDNSPTFDAWYSYRATDDSSLQVTDRAIIPNDACSWTKELLALYRSGKTSYMIESRGKMLRDWYQILEQVAPDTVDYDKNGKIIVPEVLYYYFSKFSGGALLMISNEPPPDEARNLQRRAAAVFDLAYRRFLDLQKAEAQTREAQIEAALERVRASTMAMHSSEDVIRATSVLFKELVNLGIETLRCGIVIINKDQTMELWGTSTSTGEVTINLTGRVDMTIHPLLRKLFKDWKSGKKIFSYELKGKDAERYYNAIHKLPEYGLQEIDKTLERHFSNGFLFDEGAIFAFTKEPIIQETAALFQKFTNVFILTYRRYLDLKEAEARAEEAVLKSSLDRVRAEIASMRNTDDLQRITPLVWRELRSLGVPFFRCGVFIMDEKNETVHMYLSTPTGEPLAAMDLDFDETDLPLVRDAIDHWHTQSVHRTHWDQQQFRRFTESLKKRGLIKNLKSYQQGEKPPKNLHLHQVPFKQGMLYVGSSEELGDDQIALVQSLADAFSVAYARYEDFVQLEEAKKSIENTLTELKSAQNQLIHSEKMASLGELTAGIAHEIQNPLNFVNNFSEVSNELLSELKDEIDGGNTEEVIELVEDLIQNLDKIAHHGKRASSIVKGMLDHSRASSDEKVLTDINVLADEYLRLAYHGFRAKDKSFNANFKAELAEDLPKINVVAQDIGRVLLNLVNNAFQAVKDIEQPEVVVTTKHGAKGIEIRVIDNGPGISEDIREKIFQPFFTTKAAGEGTGLGLSLSYDIVTKGHGGEIKVKTAPGKGTEFVIYLPLKF